MSDHHVKLKFEGNRVTQVGESCVAEPEIKDPYQAGYSVGYNVGYLEALEQCDSYLHNLQKLIDNDLAAKRRKIDV